METLVDAVIGVRVLTFDELEMRILGVGCSVASSSASHIIARDLLEQMKFAKKEKKLTCFRAVLLAQILAYDSLIPGKLCCPQMFRKMAAERKDKLSYLL